MKMMTKGLLAATALVTLPSMAQASVIVSPVSIVVPATTSGVYINVVTGVTGTTPAAVPGWDINPWGTSSLYFYAPTASGGIVTTTTAGTITADLAAGTVVGPASNFGKTPNGTLFLVGGDHVFGFSFLNETTGVIDYGYAHITTTTSNNGRPATITSIAYENTGASITVGANAGGVPEPASWAMMIAGFGATGVSLRRRAKTGTAVRFA